MQWTRTTGKAEAAGKKKEKPQHSGAGKVCEEWLNSALTPTWPNPPGQYEGTQKG